MPPTAKNSDPLTISLLSAEGPTRLSELSARSGLPKCITDARNASPINSHRKNIHRCNPWLCRSFRLLPSCANPMTMMPPTTHCPNTVNSIRGHSIHPVPMLHLPRISQVPGSIRARPAVGIRLNHQAWLGKPRLGQGSQLVERTITFAQLLDRPKVQCPQRTGFYTDRFFPDRQTLLAAIAFCHMP